MLLTADVRSKKYGILNSLHPSYKTAAETALNLWSKYLTARNVVEKIGEWTRDTTLCSSKQGNGFDCGVFVAMQSEAIAHGQDPCVIRQEHCCLYRRYIYQRIIHESKRQETTCNAMDCTRPTDDRIQWVQCDNCTGWFHMLCMRINKAPDGPFYCHNCHSRRRC